MLALYYRNFIHFSLIEILQVCRMWEVAPEVLHATAALGGSGLEPFYQLLEGGKDGHLAKEMEEHFFYSQMRHQSVATTEHRKVGTRLY